MRFEYIDHDTSRSVRPLILLFAGWGMSPAPFAGLTRSGYDIAVVWDYRDLSAPWLDLLTPHREIAVVAWSYGVHAAARFIESHPGLNITARIAVNGTRFTADDTRGIPRAIFDATLAGLDARAVTKFNMRMCGGGEAYRRFDTMAPARPVDELREELQSFDTDPAPYMMWDKAFISSDDRIIPPANQHNAWSGEAVEIIPLDGPHLPDFGLILRMGLNDKGLIEQCFRKAEPTYDEHATMQLATASRLIDLASQHINSPVRRMIEVGCGTGRSTEMALERFKPAEAILYDLHISPQVESLAREYTAGKISPHSCDAESEIMSQPDSSADLIISASTAQWFNSFRAFLSQVARVLVPGGICAISTYGPDTMREIHTAMGTTCRFPDIDTISHRIIPPQLQVLSVSEERDTLLMPSAIDALTHIKRTGVNGTGHRPSDRGLAFGKELLRNYPLDPQGRAPLTYHPIYMILRKP